MAEAIAYENIATFRFFLINTLSNLLGGKGFGAIFTKIDNRTLCIISCSMSITLFCVHWLNIVVSVLLLRNVTNQQSTPMTLRIAH